MWEWESPSALPHKMHPQKTGKMLSRPLVTQLYLMDMLWIDRNCWQTVSKSKHTLMRVYLMSNDIKIILLSSKLPYHGNGTNYYCNVLRFLQWWQTFILETYFSLLQNSCWLLHAIIPLLVQNVHFPYRDVIWPNHPKPCFYIFVFIMSSFQRPTWKYS